jgi:hypothetical protein
LEISDIKTLDFVIFAKSLMNMPNLETLRLYNNCSCSLDRDYINNEENIKVIDTTGLKTVIIAANH